MHSRCAAANLDVTAPLGENMETARRMGFTRYPLVRGALDQVLGIVHIRDLTAGAGRLVALLSLAGGAP